ERNAMSDVSVLSHEYQTASELSQALNRSLIVLKKGLLGDEGAAAAELEADRLCLARIADALVLLLSPAPSHAMSETAARVPGSLVARLRGERGGDLDYFLEDLRETSDRLRNRPG